MSATDELSLRRSELIRRDEACRNAWQMLHTAARDRLIRGLESAELHQHEFKLQIIRRERWILESNFDKLDEWLKRLLRRIVILESQTFPESLFAAKPTLACVKT